MPTKITTHRQASRNFIIQSLPFLNNTKLSGSGDYSPDSVDEKCAFLAAILSSSSSFINGSLAPEILMNFHLTFEVPNLLRLLCNFSSTAQFTNKLVIKQNGFHALQPYLFKDGKDLRIIRPYLYTVDKLFASLITNTRYFIRQLVHLEFCSGDDGVRNEVFFNLLPKLTALRHLKFRVPVKHCKDDYSCYYHHPSRSNLADDDARLLISRRSEDDSDDETSSSSCSSTDDDEEDEEEEELDEDEFYYDYKKDAWRRKEKRLLHCYHRCPVRGCYSHNRSVSRKPFKRTDYRSLCSLTNLETLEVELGPNVVNDRRSWFRWEYISTGMRYLRRLSLSIFPVFFDQSERAMEDSDAVSHECTWVDFTPISDYLPQLESLTLRSMPGCGRVTLRLPILYRLNNLRELVLFGVICGDTISSLTFTEEEEKMEQMRKNATERHNLSAIENSKCGNALRRVWLGGFEFVDEDNLVEPEQMTALFEHLTTTELTDIDVSYLRCRGDDYYVIDDETVEVWTRKFPLLESLDLTFCTNISNASLLYIGQRLEHLKQLYLSSTDEMEEIREHNFTDRDMSLLFDPESATSNIFTSLESLEVGSPNITGEKWFTSTRTSVFIPPTQYYNLKRLVIRNSGVTLEGLIQLFYGFSECLEEFDLTNNDGRNAFLSGSRALLLGRQPAFLNGSELEETDQRVSRKMRKLRRVGNRVYDERRKSIKIIDVIVDMKENN